MASLEISRNNGSVPFLSGSVPNEQLDRLPFFRKVNIFGIEVNCGNVGLKVRELIGMNEF
jgi:hypothetical protein